MMKGAVVRPEGELVGWPGGGAQVLKGGHMGRQRRRRVLTL